MLISQTLLIFLTLRVPVVSFQCNSYHLLCNGHKYILLGRKYIKTPANEPFYCYKNHYVMSSCWRLNPCFSLWKPNDELFRISFTYSIPNWRNKHFDLLEYRILRKNISSVDIAMSKMEILTVCTASFVGDKSMGLYWITKKSDFLLYYKLCCISFWRL